MFLGPAGVGGGRARYHTYTTPAAGRGASQARARARARGATMKIHIKLCDGANGHGGHTRSGAPYKPYLAHINTYLSHLSTKNCALHPQVGVTTAAGVQGRTSYQIVARGSARYSLARPLASNTTPKTRAAHPTRANFARDAR